MRHFFRISRFAAAFMALCLNSIVAMAQTPPTQPSTTTEGQPQMNLPRQQLRIGMYRLDVQVARDQFELETGLMFRKQMPTYEGMLFVFDQPQVQCFWMKNTLLPLTAAFIVDDGTIVNLADMAPLTETNHCSLKPVRFVLEVNQGWFAQHNLKAGMKFSGSMFSK